MVTADAFSPRESKGKEDIKFMFEAMGNPEATRLWAELEEKREMKVNEYMEAKNLPASMTGLGSFFQTHMKPLPVIGPRDLGGQLEDALYDMQLFLRYYGVHVAWVHDGFISAAHSDQDVEKVLKAHIDAAEKALIWRGVS